MSNSGPKLRSNSNICASTPKATLWSLTCCSQSEHYYMDLPTSAIFPISYFIMIKFHSDHLKCSEIHPY